jgi:hypothetical protein
MVKLTKTPEPELTGTITISAEWNHSCTPQCPADCEAAKAVLSPGIDTRMVVRRGDRVDILDDIRIRMDENGNPQQF